MSSTLRDFASAAVQSKRIRFGDLRRLKRDILPARITTREEVEVLIALDAVIERADREWRSYLIATVRDFVVWGLSPVGRIDRQKAEWLVAVTPARRSALRKCLPVRRHLPGARHRRGARHALRRQRGDATPPRRDLEPRPARRPRRAPPRSGRLAYDPTLGRAEEHHPRLPALARPRAQSGREHLAVPAPELALEPRVQNLRSDHRSGLRGLA